MAARPTAPTRPWTAIVWRGAAPAALDEAPEAALAAELDALAATEAALDVREDATDEAEAPALETAEAAEAVAPEAADEAEPPMAVPLPAAPE